MTSAKIMSTELLPEVARLFRVFHLQLSACTYEHYLRQLNINSTARKERGRLTSLG
jgi:hypothetical protein